MAQKTSIYLSDELAARIKASGIPPAELIRRGLDIPGSEELRRIVREELQANPRPKFLGPSA